MYKLGIDLGASKVVIYTSEDKGKPVLDQSSKREIPFVLEKTKPVRAFGNMCSRNNYEQLSVRKRRILSTIDTEESKYDLFFFFKYLHKIISDNYKYQSVLVAVPENLTMKHKNFLKQLLDKALPNVAGFISAQTASATDKSYIDGNSKNFAIVDFGNSKTTVGFYDVTEKGLLPLSRLLLNIGSNDIDDCIISLIIKKHNLVNSFQLRECILPTLNIFRHGLYDHEELTQFFFDEKYQQQTVTLQQKEFFEAIREKFTQIKEFVSSSLEGFEGEIEVTGKFSQCKFIEESLPGIKFSHNLHASESSAKGACLAHFINLRNDIKYKVEEIIGSEISLGEKDGKNKVHLFKGDDLINAEKTVEFSVVGATEFTVFENDLICGTIIADIPEYEEPKEFSLTVFINSFGVISVKKATIGENDIPCSIDLEMISEETLSKILEADKEFCKIENDYRKAGEIRNSTENILASFVPWVKQNFGDDQLSEEEETKIRGIVMDYMNLSSSGDLTKETKNSKTFKEKLRFIEAKLKTIEEDIRNDFLGLIDESTEFLESVSRDVKSRRLMSVLKNDLERKISSLCLSIESTNNFDFNEYKALSNRLVELKDNVISEVKYEEKIEKIRKDEQERVRKAEEEKAKKVKEENKKKEDLENKKKEENEKKEDVENKKDEDVESKKDEDFESKKDEDEDSKANENK